MNSVIGLEGSGNTLTRQLYRSKTNRVVGGVAGGLGEYLDVDPVLIRIAWAALFFLGGSGLLLYILGWVLIPEGPEKPFSTEGDTKSSATGYEGNDDSDATDRLPAPASPQDSMESGHSLEKRRRLVGGGLIILGLVFFANEFGPYWVNTELLWPLALIGVGIVILRRRDRGGN